MTVVPAERDRRLGLGIGTKLAPGEAVYTGDGHDFRPQIDMFDWRDDVLEELTDTTVDEAAKALERPTVSWINLTGIHDAAQVEALGERFGLHALSIEDILNPLQRPKLEVYDDYLYLVVKMAYELPGEDETIYDQVSVVLGGQFVLTFQEMPHDVFDSVRARLRTPESRIRRRGHDYLMYALIDCIVDGYATLLEAMGTRIDAVEDLIESAPAATLSHIPAQLHQAKRELLILRKMVLSLREAVSTLVRNEHQRLQPETIPYLRDLHDHVVQTLELTDLYRETVTSLLGLHLARVGQRTNEEMRVLTVIATIFIPLTFVVGVYGMNFDNMPELHEPWAYPLLWVVMISVAVGLLALFRRRHWL
jgi:magnesium transporter